MATNGVIHNPNEHLAIPKWINEDYFKPVLAKDEPDYVNIIKMTPVAAIPPGENFTSCMLRVHFDLAMKDGSSRKKTYIFKTMLDDDKGGAVINEIGIFPKEMKMYETYLPAYEAFYKAAGRNVQIAPKCLLTESHNGRINFVFEDLSKKNYVNTDRLKGLDIDHMTRVLKKLAEYHAASAVYQEQNGPYPPEFQEGFITRNGRKFNELAFNTKLNSYKQAMVNWGIENIDKYIAEFPDFEQYWKCAISTFDTDPNEFNVLIHGDFWSSNMMLNYFPDGSINEVLLIDFQLCKWGSPAQDLLFFLTLSPANDLRLKKFDRFIEIYYDHLIDCLKVLKYGKTLPKLRDIQISLFQQRNSFYAFFAIYNHLAIIQFPTDKDSNLHSVLRDNEEGEKFRLRLFTNPTFVEIMRELYPFFYRRGLFNFCDYE